MHIALLEHDPQDAAAIRETLARRGHALHSCAAGAELPALLRRDDIHMLVLDWPTGAANALAETLVHVRAHMAPGFPILCLCAPSDGAAIDAVLAGGASDYLLKPLRRGELAARVEALLRRAYPAAPPAEWLEFGRYAFEPQAGRIRDGADEAALTRKEFDLALLFFRHLGRPLSRAFILEAVWGQEGDVPSRTVDTHVSRVRSKLGLLPARGYRLAPVYSYGYRLESLTDQPAPVRL